MNRILLHAIIAAATFFLALSSAVGYPIRVGYSLPTRSFTVGEISPKNEPSWHSAQQHNQAQWYDIAVSSSQLESTTISTPSPSQTLIPPTGGSNSVHLSESLSGISTVGTSPFSLSPSSALTPPLTEKTRISPSAPPISTSGTLSAMMLPNIPSSEMANVSETPSIRPSTSESPTPSKSSFTATRSVSPLLSRSSLPTLSPTVKGSTLPNISPSESAVPSATPSIRPSLSSQSTFKASPSPTEEEQKSVTGSPSPSQKTSPQISATASASSSSHGITVSMRVSPSPTASVDLGGSSKSSATSASPSPSTLSLSCDITGASRNSFYMNVGGEASKAASMGADNTQYLKNRDAGGLFASDVNNITASSGPKTWDYAYSTYRWSSELVLQYRIPVPAGSYEVKLMFAETLLMGPGQRIFGVFINGIEKEKALDIYSLVGKNVGLIRTYTNVKAISKQITISLISSVENPILSGILIDGPGAGLLALGGGCKVLTAEEIDSNGGFNHRAHAVINGPYVVTDFAMVGTVGVTLDGTLSHSHYSDSGPPLVSGSIVNYKWSWTEISNGIETKVVKSGSSGKTYARFPIGRSIVTLEVVDNSGDVDRVTSTVEVKSTTREGALCYAYDYGDQVLSEVPIWKEGLKPMYGMKGKVIEFKSKDDFGDLSFVDNSFALRCSFYVVIPGQSTMSYSVKHNGPFQLYKGEKVLSSSTSSGETQAKNVSLSAGLHEFQITYFRSVKDNPLLVLLQNGMVLGLQQIQYDYAKALPVIFRLSSTSSAPSGGGRILIIGFGFNSDVSVWFGATKVQSVVMKSSGTLQVTVPPGSDVVSVTVKTSTGVSNGVPFEYTSSNPPPVVFGHRYLRSKNGGNWSFGQIASAVYGPDGRLYLGTTKSRVLALAVSKDHVVTHQCVRSIGGSIPRSVLGLAFSPFSTKLKLYFTTSTIFWKDKGMSFADGWTNGKIETIEFSKVHLEDIHPHWKNQVCAHNQQELVTGLPVSGLDHAVNKLQFLADGRLLVGIGGFTNGGISVPGRKPLPGEKSVDSLGGVASNPLSAAIVSCPTHKKTEIVYDQYVDPEKAKVIKGKECEIYATGLRNSFGMTLHTNGHLYATDNGPSKGQRYSTDCVGGSKPSYKIRDKLFKVKEYGFHGHPNLNRKECVHYPPTAVQPILRDIESSTDGIVEYRSNTFGGQMKGNLYLTKFAARQSGQISQVQLAEDGSLKAKDGFVESFYGRSGLSVVEGPRGELVMPLVYQTKVLIVFPNYTTPDVTFMIGVHPKVGPSYGGVRVLISGHKFGSSPSAKFDGRLCTDVKVIDDESFTCVTPTAARKGKLVSVRVSGETGVSPSYGTDYWYF